MAASKPLTAQGPKPVLLGYLGLNRAKQESRNLRPKQASRVENSRYSAESARYFIVAARFPKMTYAAVDMKQKSERRDDKDMSEPFVLWFVSASYHLHDLGTVLISSGESGRVGDEIGAVGGRAANFGEGRKGYAVLQDTEGMIHEAVSVQCVGWLPEE